MFCGSRLYFFGKRVGGALLVIKVADHCAILCQLEALLHAPVKEPSLSICIPFFFDREMSGNEFGADNRSFYAFVRCMGATQLHSYQ